MSVELVGFSAFEGKLSAVVKQMRETKNNAGKRVAVGILKRADEDLKMIAAVNEFGSHDGHIPSRPAFRMALRDRTLREYVRAQMVEYYRSNQTLDTALRSIGKRMKETVQRYIGSGIPPPNAPSTIKKKGHGRTLIDTGRYQRSIDWDFV